MTDLQPVPAAETGMSWVQLIDEYDPKIAYDKIYSGAIDAYLEHRPKVPTQFCDDRKLRYLRHLAATGSKQESALVAGISPTTAKTHAREDPDGFGEARDRAMDFFREFVIDRAARHFAIEGWQEPVFYKGQQVGSTWKFCPRTFELYAKRMHPDYRERVQQDVNITGGVLVIPASAASIEEWAAEAKAIDAEHEVLDSE